MAIVVYGPAIALEAGNWIINYQVVLKLLKNIVSLLLNVFFNCFF